MQLELITYIGTRSVKFSSLKYFKVKYKFNTRTLCNSAVQYNISLWV